MALFFALSAAAVAVALCVGSPAKTAVYRQESPAGSSEIALVGGRIYVSPFQTAIDNGAIIIRNGKIAAVGHKGSVHIPQGIGILDCSRMYIMAGFQNSDVHFTEAKWENAGQLPRDQLTEQLREMFTRYGFTSVVDTGSTLGNTRNLRKRIESGEVLGPHILTAGWPLYPPSGVPYYVKSGLPPDAVKRLPQPATPAEAVEQVDQHVAQGADLIELFTGSRVARGKVVTMPLAVAQAAVNEAHKRGRLVFARPSNVLGFQIALESHVDGLDGAVEDTRGWNRDSVNQMKAQQTWMIPTLTPFWNDPNLNSILREVQDDSEDHERILFGTDAGLLAGYDPTYEYVLMRRAGMDFWHILDSLTAVPAARFGASNVRGQIKAGMNADLVVIGQNPEGDIRALTQVVFTFRDGRVVYSSTEQ